jgi:ATP-dependent DNA helicase PIF1
MKEFDEELFSEEGEIIEGVAATVADLEWESSDPVESTDPTESLTIEVGEQQAADAFPTPCEFLTGPAGVGKSYVVRQRLEQDPNYAVLSSSTGISAVNLGATTIHSLLGFFNTDSLKDAYLHGGAQRKLRRLLDEGYRNIVIDECSMISSETLDLLVRVFDDVNDGRPAGSPPIGLVLTGDYAQLPAIQDRPDNAPRRGRGTAKDATPWAFEAGNWPRFSANTTKLTKIWRQDDPVFLAALNAARRGDGEDSVRALTAAGAAFESAVDIEFDGTTIVSTNEEANRINMLALDRVQGRPLSLPARRWGKLRSEWSDKLIPERTMLREGAYVMLLANRKIDSTEFEFVNGDCGHVVGVQQPPDKNSPAMILVELVRNGATVAVGPIVRHLDHRDKPDGYASDIKVPIAEDLGRFLPKPHYRSKERRYVTGQIEYYPIRLAYASTVHKVQGLTLDRVQCDMRSWQFSKPAMGYTSISRARTAPGLRLVGMKEKIAKAFVCDEKVRPWL